MRKYRVTFPNSPFSEIELDEGSVLAEHLTVENSPILFGCRTGICGTCLVRVENMHEVSSSIKAPDEAEQEVLDLFAEEERNARLACKMRVYSDLALTHLDET